jgi:hypothetical protein
VSAFIETILLLGLAAGPDEPEALADLARRIGPEALNTEAPVKPQQEDPRPQRPDAPVQAPEQASTPWIDFDWFELHVRVGMAKFSKQFYIDPSPSFAIEGRAPLPWLSPSSNPDGDYFGAFAEIAFTSIKRTITPPVDKPSGAMLSMTVGMDYSIIRNTTWMVLARVGIQYATYGGVTDLKDGMGPMAGVTAGLTISRSVSITISPEYIRGGSGDSIIIGTVGVAIDF